MVFLGIPTINLKRYLEETINSIKTTHDWKLLIVDNKSTDGTREWVETLTQYDRVLNPENLGAAKAWNQILYWGLSHDDCDLIFVLNNDIVLHPDAIDNMVESVLVQGKEGISGVNIGSSPSMLAHTTKPEPRYSPAMNFSCLGLTPKTIKRIGFFDEGFVLAYFEDNDYHHRMQLEEVDASSDLWAPFAHYGSRTIKEGGVMHAVAFEQNRKYFFNKWGYLP
jgi:GT2 family glycosyltransferase